MAGILLGRVRQLRLAVRFKILDALPSQQLAEADPPWRTAHHAVRETELPGIDTLPSPAASVRCEPEHLRAHRLRGLLHGRGDACNGCGTTGDRRGRKTAIAKLEAHPA